MRNKHFKSHKVGLRHYSGEVGKVYIIVRHIYSGNFVPNLIRIVLVL